MPTAEGMFNKSVLCGSLNINISYLAGYSFLTCNRHLLVANDHSIQSCLQEIDT